MKKIKLKFNLLILVLLLLQPFVSPELFSGIVLMLDVYFIIKYKKVYYKNIVPGFLIFFFFIFYGGMIALINISRQKRRKRFARQSEIPSIIGCSNTTLQTCSQALRWNRAKVSAAR